MTAPDSGKRDDNRRTDEEKILGVLDVVATLVRALFTIFGRRRSDKFPPATGL